MWHIFLRIPSKEVKGVIPMRKSLLALYSLSHLWVDLSCALLVFRTMADAPSFSLCLLLYNFCAFALQMPLGLLAGQWNRNGLVAASGCLLTALAFLLPQPVPTAVIAGMGTYPTAVSSMPPPSASSSPRGRWGCPSGPPGAGEATLHCG